MSEQLQNIADKPAYKLWKYCVDTVTDDGPRETRNQPGLSELYATHQVWIATLHTYAHTHTDTHKHAEVYWHLLLSFEAL